MEEQEQTDIEPWQSPEDDGVEPWQPEQEPKPEPGIYTTYPPLESASLESLEGVKISLHSRFYAAPDLLAMCMTCRDELLKKPKTKRGTSYT